MSDSDEDKGYSDVSSESAERALAINACIDKLGETCQKVLRLYYFDKLSMEEIAERMNFSNSDTAKTKKYKCKKELDEKVKALYKRSDFFD